MAAGVAGAGAPKSWLDGTAFRRAEKLYRSYTHSSAAPTDFSGVVDCEDLSRNTEANRARIRAVKQPENESAAPAEQSSRRRVYTVDGCPGVFVLPGVLSAAVQRQLVLACLDEYCMPPHANNLAAADHPASEAATSCDDDTSKKPDAGGNGTSTCCTADGRRTEDGGKAAASTQLARWRALRWATLGYQYQWGSRSYVESRRTGMPALLSDIVCSLATMVGHSFEPQSAIVNYYNPKSTMGGHVDDAEVDLSLPLVSLSLGLSAVFLFGGGTRQDVPTPIWLRSGDAIVVTGPARLCYHGVPRILADSCPEALLDAAEYERAAATAAAGGTAEAGGALACGGGLSGELVCEFMRRARLNLNVRQVVSDEVHFGTVGAQRSEALAMSSVLGCASGRRREAEE